MKHPILSPSEKLSTDDAESVIDLAGSVAATGDRLAKLHLAAVESAADLAATHHAIAGRFAEQNAREVCEFHLAAAESAEALADFHLWLLDRHLDRQIRAAADLSVLLP